LKNRDGEVDKSRHRKNSLKSTGWRHKKKKLRQTGYMTDKKELKSRDGSLIKVDIERKF